MKPAYASFRDNRTSRPSATPNLVSDRASEIEINGPYRRNPVGVVSAEALEPREPLGLWDKGQVYRLRQREWSRYNSIRKEDSRWAKRSWYLAVVLFAIFCGGIAFFIAGGSPAHAYKSVNLPSTGSPGQIR